jgi:hypothetical protein
MQRDGWTDNHNKAYVHSATSCCKRTTKKIHTAIHALFFLNLSAIYQPTNWPTPWSWDLLEKLPQLCSYSRISQHFIEHKGSLLCWQEPSTGPYTQPGQSSPYHPILSLSDKLLTFHVPNLISIFLSLGCLSKESVQVWGPLWHFITKLYFTVSC